MNNNIENKQNAATNNESINAGTTDHAQTLAELISQDRYGEHTQSIHDTFGTE